MMTTSFLEEAIHEVSTNWKPLTSSHTQTASTEEAGRKELDDTELSDKGEETRDNGSNDNREEAV